MTPRRSSLRFLLAFAAGVVLLGGVAACGSEEGGTAGPVPTARGGATLTGPWTLVSYARDGETVEAAARPATLDVKDDGKLSGTTGCNSFAGTWTSSGGDAVSIVVGPMTRMACTDEATNAQEQAMITGLAAVSVATLERGSLVLSGEGVRLNFERGPQGVEGSYQVTGVNNGRDAVVGSAANEAQSIEFSSDGTVSGNSGCNSFSGTYATSGDQLSIAQLAVTQRACADPEVDAAEQQFLAALPRVATWDRSGQTLTLRDADGAAQLVLVPASS